MPCLCGVQFAYHVTTGSALPVIQRRGLLPVVTHINPGHGPVVWFGPLSTALRYAPDREYPYILRFPLPTRSHQADRVEWVTPDEVPPESIEVYVGRGAAGLHKLYFIEDEEARLEHPALDAVEEGAKNPRSWRSIRKMKLS